MKNISEAPKVQPTVADLVESFKASMMSVLLMHRGSHGLNLLRDFRAAVQVQVERYERKPGLTRAQLAKIHDIAERCVARAFRDGAAFAFEPMER
jgi:hypothetical protein